MLLETGENFSIISDHCHADANSIPLRCRRADKSSGVEVADQSVMPIGGDEI